MTNTSHAGPVLIQSITPEQTYQLRHSVLWPDKPIDYVKVENDSDGFHFGAFRDDKLIAVISLFVDEQTARFRKFATDPDHQHQGIGTKLLSHVIAEARRLGATLLWCDARLDAADFYRRFDMEAVSEVFYKGPIPYARFSLALY
ncbi:GNAT family N-acetyltransferase [Spirosoma endbachense]|uniref:GNAT family N-acetyltransferase n=1 Tax=Spirosoma endbachense TaxID=2666025 RepID=A0A6P1VPR5_9BACT|nr:GNAT family N-acetyltransferase [Spirosoma endbachense]QHV94695.1 GNAT family N-acetyltransferase [Spirosoma endbachense]